MGQREILLTVSKLLKENKISYFLSGGFASAFYGFPRSTHDVDFILEIDMEEFSKLKKVLEKLNEFFLIDWDQAKKAIEKHTHFNIIDRDSLLKVDFWPIIKNEFNISRFKRKREEIFDRQKIWMISPEDLILIKLLWCRDVKSDRHMRDCVGILKVQKGKLDNRYLLNWAKKLKVLKLWEEVKETQDY